MKSLTISAVRSNLPGLISEIARGGEAVTITRRGKPVARIVACTGDSNASSRLPLRGTRIVIAEDFDRPLPGLWKSLKR